MYFLLIIVIMKLVIPEAYYPEITEREVRIQLDEDVRIDN